MKRWVKWALVLIGAVAAAAYVVWNTQRPLVAELIVVKPLTVSMDFTEEGIVEAAVDRPVYSPIGGTIAELPVEEGQRVVKGTLLARIDTKDLEYQLARLKAQRTSLEGQRDKSFQELGQQVQQQQLVLGEVRRQLEQSRQDYQRTKGLYEAGAASKTDLDAAEGKVKQLENEQSQQESKLQLLQAQVSGASPGGAPGGTGTAATATTATEAYFQGMIEEVDAQIRQVESRIADSRITAPVDGVVRELNVKLGMAVAPQSLLMNLTGTGGYRVGVYVLTEDVLYVKPGMKVTLIQKRKDGDYRFSGTVTAVAPSAVEKVSTLGLTEHRVKVTVQPGENAPDLRPGYALDVQFRVLEQANKLAVPKTCLFFFGDGDAVWVVRDGRARIQKVRKGMETDQLVVIAQGLNAGDLVIKNPQLEGLKEGKRVAVGPPTQ
ncbi:efflux RND transporter periplasmic adaptor subunit [Kyrpidia spormannii]|uniref:Efflux RND transporter periplasmic adaptor subunit n=1 Tax=Kyrpidia spormannii TaxID=2055160 RepID=A0A2K8N5Q6_9BACL|nr:efflux RND transporter periplasmic adaptor subunit [Kyrpidia spormannii]ATY83802.1 efflux RND transporter periplasmic adaptor subunit [Kyrpidia spormannii]